MSVKIDIELQGHHCNDWPVIEIYHEDRWLTSRQIQHETTLSFELDCQVQSRLRLRHIGKQFGEKGVWDTDSTAGLDRRILLRDIRFDDVTMGNHLIAQLPFVVEWTDLQRAKNDQSFIDSWNSFACDGVMNFNGYIDIDFSMPVYNWLILSKYKTTQPGQFSYFSDYTSNWHYEEDLKILREIKDLMRFD